MIQEPQLQPRSVALYLPTARIGPGTILSPEQTRQLMQNRPQEEIDKVAGRWVLCGELSRPFFELCASKPVKDFMFCVNGYTSPAGGTYVVVSTQLESFQHRFLIPGWDSVGGRFLQAMAHEQLTCALSNDYDERGLLLPDCGDSAWANVPDHWDVPGPNSPHVTELLKEMPQVMHVMTELDAIAAMGQPVREVNLSVVAPHDAAMRLRLEKLQ